MFILAISVIGFGLIVLGWYVFEHRWDVRQFSYRSDSDFVINVRAGKAATLLSGETDLRVIDVRPSASFSQEHIPGAYNVPFLTDGLNAVALSRISRDRPVLIYCDGGYRSRRALPELREAGFTSIYHLHRGLLSWKMAKHPTESGPAT